MIIIENDKILKSRTVRATGLFWNNDDLLKMVATPDHLLKIATQAKGMYPVIPPIQCLPARSDDEAASDLPNKHDQQGGENMDLPPMIGVPTRTNKSKERSDEVPRLPIESRTPFTQQELSQLPFSAGILPDGGEGPVKRSMERDDGTRDIKQPKTQTYPEKHSAPDVLEGERQMKQSRTSLQSSPM